MDAELRTRAEARLIEAAEAHALADPRPPFRERLRALREEDRATFDRAIRHYEENVLPELVRSEPLSVWLEYGRYLATLSSAGSVVRIDETGRAAAWEATDPAGLVLFLPDDNPVDVLVLFQPVQLSPAQTATLTLLVERRLSSDAARG